MLRPAFGDPGLSHGQPLLQVTKPVQDNLDLRSGGRSGLRLAGTDNADDSAVGTDVDVS